MPEPSDVVSEFLAECSKGKEQMHASFHRFFTSATVWENVGLATTTGVDEALGLVGQFERDVGAAHFTVDMLNIASNGDRVLTERVDHMVAADGRRLMSIRLMGIFEVSDGKILVWRDYFDTAGMR